MSPFRFAWRALASRPAFSVIVIACLTLGIAVNTTLFAVFDAILWRPYDFAQPERLVVLQTQQLARGREGGLALASFREIQRESKSFQGIGGSMGRSLTITDGEEPERLTGASVSASLFPVLGIQPQLGRLFRPDEDAGAAPTVALISDALWRRRYNADSSIIGRAIQINGEPHTVVGVLPVGFRFPETHDLWIPMGNFGPMENRDIRPVETYARLRDGVTIEQARAEYEAMVTRLEAEAGLADRQWTGKMTDLRTAFTPDEIRLVIVAMMGAVTFVLLIACANIANLMLARASSREREIAVRAALGAGRGAIVRQLLAESAILAMIAAAIAIPLTSLGLSLIDRGIPPGDEVPYYIQWRLDARVVAYAFVVSLLAALAFGLFPALQATGGRIYAALKEGGRGAGSSRSKQRTRSILVVTEVALAMLLLVGASLFVRSFAVIEQEGVGFDTAPIMTMRAFLPGTPYDSALTRQQRIEDVVRRMSALPGVQAVTASSMIPLDGGGAWSRLLVAGKDQRPEEGPEVWWSGVTSQWSRVLGLQFVAGRDLTEGEAQGRAAVAVIDDRLARDHFGGNDPLGRQFRFTGDTTLPMFTVVGVVRHYRQGQLGDREEDLPSVFVPLAFMVPRGVGVMARVAGDPSSHTAAMRDAIRAADASIPVYDVNTMEAVRRLGFWQYGLFGSMFGVFGLVALILAAIGVYGVMSYNVSQRTREFGVRLALGAQREGVLALVVRHGVSLALIGIGIGLVLALGTTRALRSLLTVSSTDPISFGVVSLFLAAVAFLASYLPARRATAVDPIEALRAD